jgi:hypothetical protein
VDANKNNEFQLSTLSKTIIILLIFIVGSIVIKVLRDMKISGSGLINIPIVMSMFYIGSRPNPNAKKQEGQKELLDKKKIKSDPTIGEAGFTELMFAAGEGDLTLSQKLIDEGVNLNQQDDKGAIALIYATLNENIDIAQLLIKNNADPDMITKKGSSAKSIAKNKEINDFFN